MFRIAFNSLALFLALFPIGFGEPAFASEGQVVAPWIVVETGSKHYPQALIYRAPAQEIGFKIILKKKDGCWEELLVQNASSSGFSATGREGSEVSTFLLLNPFSEGGAAPTVLIYLNSEEPGEGVLTAKATFPAFADPKGQQLTLSVRTATPQTEDQLKKALAPASIVNLSSSDGYSHRITFGSLAPSIRFDTLKAFVELRTYLGIPVTTIQEEPLAPVDLSTLAKRKITVNCEESAWKSADEKVSGRLAPFTLEGAMTAEDLRNPEALRGRLDAELEFTDAYFFGNEAKKIKRKFQALASLRELDNRVPDTKAILSFSSRDGELVVLGRVSLRTQKARVTISRDIGLATTIPVEHEYQTQCRVTAQ